MLSDGLNAFKLLPAFLATILIGGHVSNPTAPAACKAFYGRHLTWRSQGRANYRSCHIQRLVMPGSYARRTGEKIYLRQTSIFVATDTKCDQSRSFLR